MIKSSETPLSFRAACIWVIVITLFVSGSALVGLAYYRHIKKQRTQQADYNIVALIQTTPDKERLKTIFLAELFNLSFDRPTNLFRFSAKEAQRTLLASSLISSARVKKILPGTVYVDYTLRKPVAYLLDYSNTLIDDEAVPFPFKPFFTPKKLPEIFLGMDQNYLIWGKAIKGIKSKLALYLIKLITESCCREYSFLTRVDVSNVLADSYGQRQIIVSIEDDIEHTDEKGQHARIILPYLLRLSVENYRQELGNFLALRPFLHEQGSRQLKESSVRVEPIVIDLRVPELAYIQITSDRS